MVQELLFEFKECGYAAWDDVCNWQFMIPPPPRLGEIRMSFFEVLSVAIIVTTQVYATELQKLADAPEMSEARRSVPAS